MKAAVLLALASCLTSVIAPRPGKGTSIGGKTGGSGAGAIGSFSGRGDADDEDWIGEMARLSVWGPKEKWTPRLPGSDSPPRGRDGYVVRPPRRNSDPEESDDSGEVRVYYGEKEPITSMNQESWDEYHPEFRGHKFPKASAREHSINRHRNLEDRNTYRHTFVDEVIPANRKFIEYKDQSPWQGRNDPRMKRYYDPSIPD